MKRKEFAIKLFLGNICLLFLILTVQGQEITVNCDRVVGAIKPKLAGAAQGGNADSYLKPQVVKAIKNLGIKWVRLEAVTCNSTYTLYDPGTKTYHWTDLDREIETIQSTGAEIILDFLGMPPWLSSDPEGKRGAWYFAAPRDEDRWAEYVRRIVKHINVDRNYKIKYWEIWNEPSGGAFFTDWKFGKDRFWKFYALTARAVKAADPAALVGGFADNPDYLEHYKDFLAYARPRKVPIDFLTFHWYGEWSADGWKKPQLYKEFAQSAQRLYYKYFQRNVPIFFTEWNLNAEAGGSTPIQQAAFMGSALYWLQESPVSGANFFRVEDYKNIHRYLLDSDLQLRVPARILKMFSMLPENKSPVTNPVKDTVVLAARDQNRIVVMITRYVFSNPGSKVSPVLKFPGWTGPGKITTYLEDARSAEKPGGLVPISQVKVSAIPITVTIPLENYAVALVVVDRF